MAGKSEAAVGATARLFLALLPDAAGRAALQAHVAAWRWNADAVRYAPQDWHVTLHFLGAVPQARLDELRAGLDVPLEPFELHWGEPALWPHGLAVLLPLAVPPPLRHLHDALGQRLRQLGVPTDERPYRPHLTLARHAGTAQMAPVSPPWHGWVNGYVLMESTGRAEARYRVLQGYGDAVGDGG